jgi:hypothetical protein
MDCTNLRKGSIGMIQGTDGLVIGTRVLLEIAVQLKTGAQNIRVLATRHAFRKTLKIAKH